MSSEPHKTEPRPGEISVTVDHLDVDVTPESEEVVLYAVIDDDWGYYDYYCYFPPCGGSCRTCGWEGLEHCHYDEELYNNYHIDMYDDHHDHIQTVALATVPATGSETTYILTDLPEGFDYVITAAIDYDGWTSQIVDPDYIAEVTTASSTLRGRTCANALPAVINELGADPWLTNTTYGAGATTWSQFQAPAAEECLGCSSDGLLVAWPDFESIDGPMMGAAYSGTCDGLVQEAILDFSMDGLIFEVAEDQTYTLQMISFSSGGSPWHGFYVPLADFVPVDFEATGDLVFSGAQGGKIDLTWGAPAMETPWIDYGYTAYTITMQEVDEFGVAIVGVDPVEVVSPDVNHTAHSFTVWSLPTDRRYEFSIQAVALLPDLSRAYGPVLTTTGSTSAVPGSGSLSGIANHQFFVNSEARDIYPHGILVGFEESPENWKPDHWQIVASAAGQEDIVVDVMGGRLAAAIPLDDFAIYNLTLTAFNDDLSLQTVPTAFPTPFNVCDFAYELQGDAWRGVGGFSSDEWPNDPPDGALDRWSFFEFDPSTDPLMQNQYSIEMEALDMRVYEGTGCDDLVLLAEYDYTATSIFGDSDISFAFIADSDPATSFFIMARPQLDMPFGPITSALMSDPTLWMMFDRLWFEGHWGPPGRPLPSFAGEGNPLPELSSDFTNTCGNLYDFQFTVTPPEGFYLDAIPMVGFAFELGEGFDPDSGPDPEDLLFFDFAVLGLEPWTSPIAEAVEIDPDEGFGAIMYGVFREMMEPDECDTHVECDPGYLCDDHRCLRECWWTDWDCDYSNDWCDMSYGSPGVCRYEEHDPELMAFEIVRPFPPSAGDTNGNCGIDVTDIVNIVVYYWASRPPTPDYAEMARAIPNPEPVMRLDPALACDEPIIDLENCITMGYPVAVAQIILDNWGAE